MKKTDFRSVDSTTRQAIRERAIRMISKGKKKKVVAEYFSVNQNTITQWVKKHKEKGAKGLIDNVRGVKSKDKKKLTPEQENQVQSMILDTMPDQLKLAYSLWTRKAVKELIEREFKVKMAINTAGDYLRAWGYSPQKPKKKAYEQNPKKVQEWLIETYPKIKEKAIKEGAEIHWGDETGARNCNYHGRSYAPKGHTPVKKSMAKRFSINMISTVTNQGQVEFMIYSGTMNSDRLIVFLKQLIKTKRKKIFLILDNLRVHHSNLVKEWVEENKDKIELFFLPPYSPEKNPDEYLNCDLKYGLSEKKSPKDAEQLKENVKNHMIMLQENQNRVKKYFNHPDIKYAT